MDRVALVTGASSGLGRALALRLAEEGWAIGLVARREDALQAVAARIEARGGRAAVLPADVADREAVLAAATACHRRLGAVDLLVAGAGISENTRPRSLDGRDVERILRVNFLGAVYATEAVLPAMLERRAGQLVVVASLAGLGGLPLSGAYSASKAALMGFFESLRIDLRPHGVAVTVLAPGYVRTPLTAKNLHRMPFLLEEDDAVERMLAAIRRRARFHAFPWPLAGAVGLARLLPRAWYDRWIGRVGREKRG